jgi:hypothetical protein
VRVPLSNKVSTGKLKALQMTQAGLHNHIVLAGQTTSRTLVSELVGLFSTSALRTVTFASFPGGALCTAFSVVSFAPTARRSGKETIGRGILGQVT